MMRLPRVISPSQVEIGDLIEVEHSRQKGVTTTYRGRVRHRVDSGQTRIMQTREGATILAWNGKENPNVTVTLIQREPAQQTNLW